MLRRNQQALETYLRVLALRPDDALSHNNLAVVYFGQGELVRARQHVARAREPGLAVHPGFLEALERAERKRS